MNTNSNRSDDLGTANLLVHLERWQRRAEELETTVRHERELRLVADRFLRTKHPDRVVAIREALERAARVVGADRAYAVLWRDGTTSEIVWSNDSSEECLGSFPAGFVDSAMERIRRASTVEATLSPALRSLLWVPIASESGVDGLVGCDSAHREIYWSPARRQFLHELASLIVGVVAATERSQGPFPGVASAEQT